MTTTSAMRDLDPLLPLRFCWTRFGVESGEPIESIFARKEAERMAHDGMFLWGIGNSVGSAVRELVRREPSPKVLFSPMRSKPKLMDVAPSAVFGWTRALTMSDDEWHIPKGLQVVSRAVTNIGTYKRSHYALVCKTDSPLRADKARGVLNSSEFVNLLSLSKLGHSQVTSVVQRKPSPGRSGTHYPICFIADLVFPYFVRLVDPVLASDTRAAVDTINCRLHSPSQRSLLSA